ncbi:olfactory receptor 2A14-like [Neolamprologus brichardi]|uniref:olfactory receptor 2A14-like n=1 Tax=Neolamprologus brichardi TaxID=32507 RepID=UPI0003EC4BA6|nr:olfactory receptor 2A14-like [Neolamprologus brichardi]
MTDFMILLVWIYSFLSVILSFSFIFSLKFCGNNIENVYCDHQLIIRLSCSLSVHSFLSDIFFLIVSFFIPCTLISVSYVKILAVCRKTSTENKQKAATTCAPQIVSVSNLFVGSIFHSIDSNFIITQVPNEVRIILPMYMLIFQPMLTPFLYGFKLPKIRHSCKRLLFKRKSIALF